MTILLTLVFVPIAVAFVWGAFGTWGPDASSLGRQMGSPKVITEIDRGLVLLAQLRDFAASMHSTSKPAPWRRNNPQ